MAFVANSGGRRALVALGSALAIAAVWVAPQFAEAETLPASVPAQAGDTPMTLSAPAVPVDEVSPSSGEPSASLCDGQSLATSSGGFQAAQRLSLPPPVCGGAAGSAQPPVGQQPTDARCTVSALLVPACGAWLGAATTDAALTYDYGVGLAEYESVAGNAPDIQHFYKSGGGPFPTRSQQSLAHRPGHQRSLMLINWKPSASHTWRQVADGAADAWIESAAAGMKAYPHKFFLNIWHEPENDFGAGRQPADYVAMYRHVVTKLRALGVTNVVYVWNMMGYSGYSHLYDSLYPGHEYVDWIAWDPYAKKGANMAELINENCCKVANWTGFYDWATRKAPGKPLMLAEWGFNLLVNPHGPSALDSGAATVRDRFPALKAFVYWNENRTGTYRIDTGTALGQAYGQAYRRFANDPYFNSTSPDGAP